MEGEIGEIQQAVEKMQGDVEGVRHDIDSLGSTVSKVASDVKDTSTKLDYFLALFKKEILDKRLVVPVA